MVEKLLNVDFSRFEDGDMLCCGPVSHIFQTPLNTIHSALTSARSPRRRRQVEVV
jgi:hypothetical protein